MKNSNTNNLFSLWRLAGSEVGQFESDNGLSLAVIGDSEWPNRVWINSCSNDLELGRAESLMRQHQPSLKFSIFESLNESADHDGPLDNFNLVSTQTGMDMELKSWSHYVSDVDINLIPVESIVKANEWARLFQESFGYRITINTIIKLCNKVSFQLIQQNGAHVGTVILYGIGETVGVHSLGVIPTKRGKGIAKATMRVLLNKLKEDDFKRVSLQASNAALKMYENLGFRAIYKMLNYQINK